MPVSRWISPAGQGWAWLGRISTAWAGVLDAAVPGRLHSWGGARQGCKTPPQLPLPKQARGSGLAGPCL